MANSSLSSSFHCSDSTYGGKITFAFAIIRIVVLVPLCLLVLHLGLQRWRQQGSFATTSHSDIFTYHSAAMELVYVLGFVLNFCGFLLGLFWLEVVGVYVTSNIFCGQISFHILTCVERYLAVVHPIAYLGLKQSGGARIRNVSAGCVWLLYCGWIGVTEHYYPDVADVPFYCFLVSSLVVVSFCSLAVLWVLIRPGPGERADPTKHRAFHTVAAITAVLWLYVLGLLVSFALEKSGWLSYEDGCVVLSCGYMASLPSILVLPLLFLHRAEKLVCCRSSKE